MAENRQNRGPAGPGGRNRFRGPRPKLEHPWKLLGRVLSYVMKRYKFQFLVVLACIAVSVAANLQGTLFTRTLIDSYIMPLLASPNPDFGPLAGAIGRVAIFYGIGVLASFSQSIIMVYITQGTMRDLRTDVFTHMEKLPISYFDTHSHGDIMSIYTNDVDTLRQMISQSLTQTFNADTHCHDSSVMAADAPVSCHGWPDNDRDSEGSRRFRKVLCEAAG